MKFAIKCQSKLREFHPVARAQTGHAIKEMFRKFSVLLGGSEADAVQKRSHPQSCLRRTAGGQKLIDGDDTQSPFLFAHLLLGFAKIFSEGDGPLYAKQKTILQIFFDKLF